MKVSSYPFHRKKVVNVTAVKYIIRDMYVSLNENLIRRSCGCNIFIATKSILQCFCVVAYTVHASISANLTFLTTHKCRWIILARLYRYKFNDIIATETI